MMVQVGGTFTNVRKFFRSVGGFFRDIVAPIGISFIPGAGPAILACSIFWY